MPDQSTTSASLQELQHSRGLIAHWNFAEDGADGWVAHSDPAVQASALRMQLGRIGDEARYGTADWPHAETHPPLVDGGPFGKALRCDKGWCFGVVDRDQFDHGALDCQGKEPLTLMAWLAWQGKRHLVAGVWDEGGWDPYAGRRQYALFGGLFRQPGTIAHVSATGAASYPQVSIPGAQYARIRAIDPQTIADGEWVCMAMTIDPSAQRVTAWTDGQYHGMNLLDPITEAVFGAEAPAQCNPLHFDHNLFGPAAPTLKWHGYDPHAGIAEHRLVVDRQAGHLFYEALAQAGQTLPAKQRYQVDLSLTRTSGEIAWKGHIVLTTDGTSAYQQSVMPYPGSLDRGDQLQATLFHVDHGQQQQLGQPLNYRVEAGAPFTLGRAPGLGKGEIEHGSRVDIAGLAVWNRCLSTEEMQQFAHISIG